MHIYLSAMQKANKLFNDEIVPEDVYGLCTFCDMKPSAVPYIKRFKSFMLDSGAFTFMNSGAKNIDWVQYADTYAEFVKTAGIDLFFELDIDVIIGKENARRLRDRIERNTGKQSIPVWHGSRGMDEYCSMCKEYGYVAVGGIAVDRVYRNCIEKYLDKLIDIAHENDCKIHGLGYTNTKRLHDFHFDSVDSTSWQMHSNKSNVCMFEDGTIKYYNGGGRVVDRIGLERHNLAEWIKFSKYAEEKL